VKFYFRFTGLPAMSLDRTVDTRIDTANRGSPRRVHYSSLECRTAQRKKLIL